MAILIPLAGGLIAHRAYVAGMNRQLAADAPGPPTASQLLQQRRSRHEQHLAGLDTNDLSRGGNFDRLWALRPAEADWRGPFDVAVANLRSNNQWLDLYFDHPSLAPSTDASGNQPGPTTRQHFDGGHELWQLIREDYLQNNVDTADQRDAVLGWFDRNFLDWFLSNPGSSEDRRKVQGKMRDGGSDPIVAILSTSPGRMDNALQQSLNDDLPAMINRRPMSAATLMVLCSQLAPYFESIDDATRASLSMRLEDRMEELLQIRNDLPGCRPQFDFILPIAAAIGNGLARADWLYRILDLREEPKTAALVPTEFLHRLMGETLWKAAVNVRGGDFVGQTNPKRMELFRVFGKWAMNHLMMAYISHPDDPYIALKLVEIENALGETPLSVSQWYRIGKTLRCDSLGNAQMMARRLQPRWGGSLDQLSEFVLQSIDASTRDPNYRLHFLQPLESYLTERGQYQNWVTEDSIGQPLVALAQASLKNFPGGPSDGNTSEAAQDAPANDPRFGAGPAAVVTRALWDAGELETLDQWLRRHQQDLTQDWLYHHKTPPGWSTIRWHFTGTAKLPAKRSRGCTANWSSIPIRWMRTV